MSEIKFHKANALPSPINSTHDGVWLIADGANNYKHFVITGGVVKKLTVDGEDLTLEQARTNNNTVEGVILGSEEFDKEGNRNAFIQLSDLEDALSEIPELTNDDNTLTIDEDIIRLNVTNITEEFTANGIDRNFEMTNVYASIENVFINGVRIKKSDYITISEQEIEIKTTVSLLSGDEVVIQGTMFIVE